MGAPRWDCWYGARAVTFRTLLLGHRDDHTAERITAALDRMSPGGRLDAIRAATPCDEKALWELFKDSPVAASDLVPPGTKALAEVIHEGKNTLPVHKLFQKRFCAPEDGSETLWGYNHHSLAGVTGPGYFMAHPVTETDAPSAYAIDYREVPPKGPSGWPAVQPNEKGLGRFIYAGMVDYLRKVSDHVLIGRAYRGAKPMNAYFLLCRQEPEAR